MTYSGYLDGTLKINLDACKKLNKNDWDTVIICDGDEGAGKSVLVQQAAIELDPTFNIERICFTPKELLDAIDKAEKRQAIIYDEAFTGMGSRAAMSEINKMLNGVLMEIRQKNLFVFIVLPCFFELDKYPAIWRSRCLLHVYAKGMERGRFAFYGKDKKKNLYILGKKFYSYKRPKPDFRGRFVKGYTVDEEAYRNKKLKALTSRQDDDGKTKTDTPTMARVKKQRDMALHEIEDKGWRDCNSISKWLDMPVRTVQDVIKKRKDALVIEKETAAANCKQNINILRPTLISEEKE